MPDIKELPARILGLDTAFLWVMVFDEKGKVLAKEYTKGYNERQNVKKEEMERLVALDAIFLEAYSQAEKWYGKTDFLLLAYQDVKIMLIYSKKRRLYVAAKIPRSAMAEYLYPMVSPLLESV